MQIFYKSKTPIEFNTLLLTEPFFKENWKLIPTVRHTLNTILKYNYSDKGPSEISYKLFFNRYGPEYATILHSLTTLGLLHIDHSYTPVSISTDGKGHCKNYSLTELAHTLLADANKEYLYKLLTDKATKRKNQKAISRRGYNKLNYGDVRDDLKKTNDGISYDPEAISQLVDCFPTEKKAFTYTLLIDILEKKYNNLHFNTTDGRVWSPYTQLPPEIKKLIYINGLAYQMTIDIRSCYPSFWAEYILTQPILPHIVYGNVDNEKRKYNDLWLNPSIDPKKYLSDLLGIEQSEIKEVLIAYFNGHSRTGNYKKFDNWIKKEFPTLYKIWSQTDIKQTGNNIGKNFETKLMLDRSIYKKAKELGIILGYEYDGMSFYAKDNSKCDELLAFIENKSVELLGIKLVFVRKYNTITLNELIHGDNVERLSAQINDRKRRLKQVCNKAYRTQKWTPFYIFRNEIRMLEYERKDLEYEQRNNNNSH
jgi:hypothetical protein